ncbi:MAG: integration host factor subunit alpha [Zetaproteobacteria bacterium]|nr:MAG: integration host factor subunit alpha [Zetaproteobacteria bacterium]
MTKAEIAKVVHERVGLSKKESGQIVDVVLDVVHKALEQGEDVKLSGFGHFMVRNKRPRRGRNPKTGDEITISSRRIVTFRASQLLKNQVLGEDQ